MGSPSLGIGMILVLLLLPPPAVGRALPPRCDFAGLYNFGDSNSDTGGISAAFLPILPPNGVSFFRKPAGRVSDGRLIIDFMAEQIGLPYLSAYLDTINTDYRHGANFATGGSTIRRPNESIFVSGISPFPLDIQTAQFSQFKARTIDLYNQVRPMADRSQLQRPEDFSKALYTIDIGQNDLSFGFRRLGEEQLRAAIPDLVDQFALSVQNLYEQGARAFWVHNTGPLGCLPESTRYVKEPMPGFLDEHGCIVGQNNMAMEFNRRLQDRVRKLRTELPRVSIVYVDVYAAKYQLISTASSQGFTDPHKICCGWHQEDTYVYCGKKAIVNGTEVYGAACGTPSAFISWDGVHYTQAASQWIAGRILNGSLSDPPVPVTHACYGNTPTLGSAH